MIQSIKRAYNSILEIIKPIKGICYFLFLFFLFEIIWKICFPAHEDEGFYFFNKNYTSWLEPLCYWTTDVCYWVVHDLMGYKSLHKEGIQLYFDNSIRLNIVWGCTGFKQILQFSFILVCFWGQCKKKLVFIPCAIFILILFNIIRLVVTLFVVKDGFPDWFIPINEIMTGTKWDASTKTYWKFYVDWYTFFHDKVFRWVYYDGVVFLLWIVWHEKFSKVKTQKSNN